MKQISHFSPAYSAIHSTYLLADSNAEIRIVITENGLERIEVWVVKNADENEYKKAYLLLERIRFSTYHFCNEIHEILGIKGPEMKLMYHSPGKSYTRAGYVLPDLEFRIVITEKGIDRIEILIDEVERKKMMEYIEQVRLATYQFRNKIHDILGIHDRKHIVVWTYEDFKNLLPEDECEFEEEWMKV